MYHKVHKVNSMIFSKLTLNYTIITTVQFENISITSEIPMSMCRQVVPNPVPGNQGSVSISIDFLFLNISRNWNHTMCDFYSCLFEQHNAFEVQTCSMY